MSSYQEPRCASNPLNHSQITAVVWYHHHRMKYADAEHMQGAEDCRLSQQGGVSATFLG